MKHTQNTIFGNTFSIIILQDHQSTLAEALAYLPIAFLTIFKHVDPFDFIWEVNVVMEVWGGRSEMIKTCNRNISKKLCFIILKFSHCLK